ncbi:Predicted kinase, aminoglycoside phosphotransferase (APT) family [Sphingobium faniae]|nr:Predicted kinase, aminoglycoside phosphotransferase (APT) family [Sphingobium faniae]
MDFSPDNMARYLDHRLGGKVRIDDISRFGRGTSRQTWFVDAMRDGEKHELVFRLDLDAGSFGDAPLDEEYFIYERLGHTNVPAARALWWEDDPQWATTAPFYVRSRVDGDWNIPNFTNPDPRYDDLRIRISKEWVRKIAIVHAVDWKGLGIDQRLPAPKSLADCGPNYVNMIVAHFEADRIEGDPILLESAERLRDIAPPASKICLCKGTNGFGEEIFRGEEIVALSDWEEVSIGDPANDFAYVQYLVPEIRQDGKSIWGMAQALDYYEELTGTHVPLKTIDYYRGVRMLRMLVMMARAAAAVHRYPRIAEVRQLYASTEVALHSHNVLLQSMGLKTAFDPEIFQEVHMSVEVLS